MKLSKKFISLLLALTLMCLPLAACKKNDEPEDPDSPDDEFSGSISQPGDPTEPEPEEPPIGEGDENAVYEIRTADDLKNINRKGKYVLMNDIDLTGIEFSPIGTYYYPFSGEFDGQGYTIRNLTIVQSSEDQGDAIPFKYVYCGLFGVTNEANIHNVNFENASVSASSTTEYCFVTSGIVAGYMIDTQVSDCTVSGEVKSTSKHFNSYSGGVSGIIYGGKITSTVCSANVETYDSRNRSTSGGIAGYSYGASTLEKCTSSGNIKAVSSYGLSYSGGILGNARTVSATACRSESEVYSEVLNFSASDGTSGTAYAGGIVAVSSAETEETKAYFRRCYALEKSVTAKGNKNTAYAAGIAAKISFTEFKDCYSLCDTDVSSDTESVFAASAFAYISGSEYSVSGCFARGDVSVNNSNVNKVNIGTFCAYPDKLDENSKISNSVYGASSAFTVNGEPAGDLLTKTAESRLDGLFTLEHLVGDLKWNPEEWETVDGVITAK